MVFYNVRHTFSITCRNVPQIHCSQIEPHRAQSYMMRFEVRKWMNLVELDFPVKSDEKWFFTMFVIQSVLHGRIYLRSNVPRPNRTMRTAVWWGLKAWSGRNWYNLISKCILMKNGVLQCLSYIQYYLEGFTSVRLFLDRAAPCASPSDEV